MNTREIYLSDSECFIYDPLRNSYGQMRRFDIKNESVVCRLKDGNYVERVEKDKCGKPCRIIFELAEGVTGRKEMRLKVPVLSGCVGLFQNTSMMQSVIIDKLQNLLLMRYFKDDNAVLLNDQRITLVNDNYYILATGLDQEKYYKVNLTQDKNGMTEKIEIWLEKGFDIREIKNG